MNTFILNLFALFFLNLSFGQTVKDWNALSEEDFSIQYPSNWDLDQSGSVGTEFILYAPFIREDDLFNENINLRSEDLMGSTLEEFVYISEKYVTSSLKEGKLISSELVYSEENKYYKLVYTGKLSSFHLKYEQYIFEQNDQIYLLTLTSDTVDFEDIKDTGEQILNSFTLN